MGRGGGGGAVEEEGERGDELRIIRCRSMQSFMQWAGLWVPCRGVCLVCREEAARRHLPLKLAGMNAGCAVQRVAWLMGGGPSELRAFTCLCALLAPWPPYMH